MVNHTQRHVQLKAMKGACNRSVWILALTCPSPGSSASASDLPKIALQLSSGKGLYVHVAISALPRLPVEEEQVGACRWHILVVSYKQAQYDNLDAHMYHHLV